MFLSGTVVTNTSNISTNATNLVATGAIVDTLSGTVVTNTSNISANSGDIVIVSGLIGAGIPVATGARIDSNTSNISTASGGLQTQITNNIYTWQATGVHSSSVSSGGSPTGITISQGASLAISGTSGISVNLGTGTTDKFVVTHDDTSSSAGLTVTPNNFITSVVVDTYGHITGLGYGAVSFPGGGAYSYWTASDGSNTAQISNAESVILAGAGGTTVTLDSAANTYTISGAAGGTGGGGDYAWTMCGANVPSGGNVTISGGSGIQVSCGLGTTIETTGMLSEAAFAEQGYDFWRLQGDGSSQPGPHEWCENDKIVSVTKAHTVQIQGSGGVAVCMDDSDSNNTVVTISGDHAYKGWDAKGYGTGIDLLEQRINSTDDVTITGVGSVDVLMLTGAGGVTYSISGIEGEAYSYWRATDGVTINNVIDNELITWTGVGHASVSMAGTTFSISGGDTIYLGGFWYRNKRHRKPLYYKWKNSRNGRLRHDLLRS